MEKINQGHPLSQSPDFVKENIELLKSLFPTIVKEGKIVMEELEALLGEDIEKEEEYYNFTWAGKSMARRESNKPSTATLRPDKLESKNWDKTKNIFIEGDNLEVLKLIQKSYANQVKIIYIDPPYNTGNDFIYKDDFSDNLSNYLKKTQQIDEGGNKKGTNSESDGKYHSNWLTMMYSRLRLSKKLLKNDGFIFISIDDHELANLKKLCDEVFGEESFVGQWNWYKSSTPPNLSFKIKKNIEYILCYTKKKNNIRFKGIKKESKSSDPLTKTQNSIKELEFPPGILKAKFGNRVFQPGIYGTDKYPNELLNRLEIENGTNKNPVIFRNKFVWTQDNLKSELEKKTDIFISDKLVLSYKKKEYSEEVPPNFINDAVNVETTEKAGVYLDSIFGGKRVFSYPKPVSLISYILNFIDPEEENEIVLDFFAGSGTTAEAVFFTNAQSKKPKYKFVLVQLDEEISEQDALSESERQIVRNAKEFLDSLEKRNVISSITKERIRRAGDNVKSEISKDLFNKAEIDLDIGFRVFKLDTSNIRTWDGNPEKLEENLFTAGKNIKEDRTEEDVLFEILLKYGLNLTVPIEEKSVKGKMVYSVGYGTLFICLSDNITTEVADAIGQWKEELEPPTSRVIFKDSGFNDVQKTNSIQILKRFGINEVNTI